MVNMKYFGNETGHAVLWTSEGRHISIADESSNYEYLRTLRDIQEPHTIENVWRKLERY